MGAFVVNFHVQGSSQDRVTDVLQGIGIEGGWISGPTGRWISFWDSLASRQDTARIQEIAQPLSRQLEAPVIAFLNHDSDFICYWLYDNGKLLDEYNSCPGYFDGDASQESAMAANCELLRKYCRTDTSVEVLEEILKIWTPAEAMQGITSQYVFAEERLSALAPHLEIRSEMLYTDYGDIGRDVQPEEVGALWIGQGEPSDHPGIFEIGMEDFEGMAEMGEESPAARVSTSPVHEAAMRGDLAAIERLVGEGANINETNQMFIVPPLSLAAGNASPEFLRRMVELGADVHFRGNQGVGSSPLHMAVMAGKGDNVRELIALGADVNEYDQHTGTLLHAAAMRGSKPVVKLLLELGADPTRLSPNGETPADIVRNQLKQMDEAMKMMRGMPTPPQLQEHIDGLKKLEEFLSESPNEES